MTVFIGVDYDVNFVLCKELYLWKTLPAEAFSADMFITELPKIIAVLLCLCLV